MMTDYVEQKSKEIDCTMITRHTGNFNAHRFYYNQGFVPKFHFLKILNEDGFVIRCIW
jgi:hypothetical protein